MKKALIISLSDEELLDLCRIIIDKDEGEALLFLEKHLKSKVHDALEGG